MRAVEGSVLKERLFVEPKVLLYSLDPPENVKGQMAHSWVDALWKSGAGAASWQVLEVLKISARTVRRDWEFARVWLAREVARRSARALPELRREVESLLAGQNDRLIPDRSPHCPVTRP